MLRTALPISAADFQLAVHLLRRLISWKEELHDRSFVITASWADHFDVKELFLQFKTIFPNTAWAVLPDVPEDLGWPEAANHVFVETAKVCAGEPFYFMEADNFPLQPCFIDSFESEYVAAGKPYMGAIEPSRWTIAGEYVEKGTHMVGTGIYPADFLTRCKLVHSIHSIPFDVYMESDIIPECHETKLISHHWSTKNYRFDDDGLIMDDNVVRPGKHSYVKPVNSEAVVIHGCKDESLYKLFK